MVPALREALPRVPHAPFTAPHPRTPAHLWGVEAPTRDWSVLREVLMTESLALRMEERGLGIECLGVLECG